MTGDLLPTRLSTRLSQLPLLVTLRHDYRRFNQYLASFVKFNVCIIFLFTPEYIPPNLVKIHAQLKKWQAISVSNSAFSQLGLGLGLPLLVTTHATFSLRMHYDVYAGTVTSQNKYINSCRKTGKT